MNLQTPTQHVAPDLVATEPVSSAHVGDRRRRPTGAPPPLPRSLGWTGRAWGIGLLALTGTMAVLIAWDPARRALEQADAAVLRLFASGRTGWTSSAARGVDRVATGWVLSGLMLGLLIATAVCKRWRHTFTFIGSFVVVALTCSLALELFQRPRPYDVTTIGRWFGYAAPSVRVALVSLTAVGIVYSLVVPGRPRRIAKAVAAVAVGALVLSRLLLGVDRLTDALGGVAFGVAIPLVAFRFFTPNEAVPVAYGGGKTAHLDVGGRRGEAIRRAVEDQLGLTVLDVRYVGLAGSGGSTPLRITVAGDPDTVVFGKLYAMSHVRSDRWYKAGRTVLYGRLEDERPFQSVRRLVQYEDYLLRVMRDAGIPTMAPLGIVELTPEREYMLLAEFVVGGVEIGDAEVDDQLIDEGLALVRRLWDAGLSHRDIKPANILVRDGHLVLIDVAFSQVRPSPWRQAVDLANMMLVLAVRTDAERVYRRALAYFTPDEMAEAFAAARGVASPTQLRMALKHDGRDLLTEMRALAPRRRPISLQRWGPRRVAMVVAVVLGGYLAVTGVYQMMAPAQLNVGGSPTCGTSDLMVLLAQAVPTTPGVPCLQEMPAGWTVENVRATNGEARFWLDSDRAGRHAIFIRSTAECDTMPGPEVDSDEAGWQRFDGSDAQGRLERTYVASGGCVEVRGDDLSALNEPLLDEIEEALSIQPRAELVDAVQDRTGLALCGAGAPPCTGE